MQFRKKMTKRFCCGHMDPTCQTDRENPVRQEPDAGDKAAKPQRNKGHAKPQRFFEETEATTKEIIGGVKFCFHINKYGGRWSRIEISQDFILARDNKGVFTLDRDRSLH
jgi:hypothetical protein